MRDPLATDVRRAVESFVAERFPAVEGVVLAGSSASGTSTPTSDLDLVLIGPAEMFDGGRTSLAATFQHEGRLVEVFAYTPDGLREWAERDVAAHRPVLLTMVTEGVVLRSSPALVALREWAVRVLAAGPRVDRHALDVRRYLLSALLDDLADATDPGERTLMLADAFGALAELLLLAHGHWLGSGKWLVRRLRAWDAAVAEQLCGVLAAGDATALVQHADELLAPLGGRLQAGMVR